MRGVGKKSRDFTPLHIEDEKKGKCQANSTTFAIQLRLFLLLARHKLRHCVSITYIP